MSDIINIIPTKEIQFKTKSLLEDILSRLELSQRDRLDLQRYIEFGGGENLDNLKETLEFVRDNLDIFIKNKHNFEIFVEYVDKIYALFEEAPEEFDTLKEIADWIKNIQLYKIVDELPEKGEDNKIYLINSNNPLDNNKYQEYIYVNDAWEEIGGSIPLNLLDFSNNVITFAPTKQSIITYDDFKTIVEKYDLINKKGLSLPCLYKKNKSDKFGFGILAFSSNDIYQRIDIIVNSGLNKNEFSDDKSLYSPTIQLANHAYLYDTRYNILTPLGVYIFKEFVLEDYSVTEKKLAKNVIENIIEKVSQDIDIPYSPFEKGEGENSAVLKDGNNHAIMPYGVAMGENTSADGTRAFTLGYRTIAQGENSFASGQVTKAIGLGSHAEGNGNGSRGKAEGMYSHSEGNCCNAIGYCSHAEGIWTDTTNDGEHAEGQYNKSNAGQNPTDGTVHSVGIGESNTNRKNAHEIMKNGKHFIYGIGGYDGTNPDSSDDLATVINDVPFEKGEAENSAVLKGGNNTAQTAYSSAFGRDNVAKGHASFVEGRENKANGDASHAEGYKTKAAYVGHSEGQETTAQGDASHAEGNLTIAYGSVSHAEGNKTTAYGDRSHAEGISTNKFTDINVTDGDYQKAWETNNDFSMSFGDNSHVEGGNNFAGGAQAHAEGWKTEAIGENSHTEGTLTKAVGKNAHAEGGNTLAEGNHSHAGGWQSKAVGAASHASGYYTETNNRGEAAFGNFNMSIGDSDESENTAFSVGIGTKSSERKNAFEVKQNGDIYIEGVEGRIQNKLNASTSVTPDWLAGENEAGYIKNKPFGLNGKIGTLTNSNPYIETYTYYDVVFVNKGDILTCVNNTYTGEIVVNGGPPVYCKIEDITENGRNYKKLTLIDNYNYFTNNNPIDVYVSIKHLDELYIPNTIVRKTDLGGFNPFVWEYMCNPYVIVENIPIPEEVHSMISNDDLGIQAICLKTVLFDNYGVIESPISYSFDSITFTNSIVLFYDSSTHMFTII